MMTLVSILLFVLSSAFLIWFFIRNDFGFREHKGALFASAVFGLLGLGFAVWAESVFSFLTMPGAVSVSVGSLFVAGMTIGLIEEIGKFVPLAAFIRHKTYFNEHTDGVIYFGVAGLMFGFVENVAYALIYSRQFTTGEYTGIARLVFLFFFHAASTGIVGYYFAKAKIRKESDAKPIIALLVMAFVHGMYDFLVFYAAASAAENIFGTSEGEAMLVLVSVVSGLIISVLLNTFLFLYFRRARQWDISIGLARHPEQSAAAVPPPPVQGIPAVHHISHLPHPNQLQPATVPAAESQQPAHR